MNNRSIIWVASFPRSGNTFLRTILWQCFGFKSISVYPNDLGNNQKLEEYVGHIEAKPGEPLPFASDAIPLVKTHELSRDNYPAIYVIRDGRAACVSQWQFENGAYTLDSFIDGQRRFGSWSDHVLSWDPWNRPNTLLLKYEDMIDDLPLTLNNISQYIQRDIISHTIPDRDDIANVDGQWVKTKKNWETQLTDAQLQRYNRLNGKVLRKAGYLV